MKSAWNITPESSEEAFVRSFDLREIDARPPSFWSRKWWARNSLLLDIVRSRIPAGGRVLDLGCAQGNLVTMLGEEGYRCVGLDLRLTFLKYAKKKDDGRHCRWVVGNAFAIPFAPASFDAVILGEILEHVAEPAGLMRMAMDFVEVGGLVVCTTPNGACFRNSALPNYVEASRDLEDLKVRQFGPAGEDHLFALRPREMLSLAPDNAQASIDFAVSALWCRALSLLARSSSVSGLFERVSLARPWRTRLADTLVVILERLE